MEFYILFIIFQLISQSCARLHLDDFPNLYPFDRDLHERVLDEKMCQRQLHHMMIEDIGILTQFVDAGARTPKGILKGNLRDIGNYHQCLSIRQDALDMTFEGKYCLINVPLNQEFDIPSIEWPIFDPDTLKMDGYLELLEQNELKDSQLRNALSIGPDILGSTSRLGNDNTTTFQNLALKLAICIPKVCTTHEAINSILNITSYGFVYEDNMCRLPNDRHWVAGDYVAIVLFSVIGFLIVVSTSYDLYHLCYLKRSTKRMHPLRLFSAYLNMANLLRSSGKPGTLECLDGIRALAIIWVVLGHTFYIIPYVGANMIDIAEWQQKVQNIWVTGALLTVDTFFMLSGLLVVYIGYVKFTPKSLLMNLHKFYLGRLLRMFPILAIVILFEVSLYNRISDGGFWYIAGENVHKCRAFWWTTLLHIQNFVNPHQACLGVTWYLAIDVQLHLISPLVLFWLLRGSKRSSWSALIIGLTVSLLVATLYIFLVDSTNDYYAQYYVNVLTRSPPFFVGMIIGYILRIYRNKKVKMSRVISAFFTLVAVGMTYLMLYLNYLHTQPDWKENQTSSKLIDAFSRAIWAASLGWIIFVCVNGYGGPINWFLCLEIWKIPAKVSYGMYLVHYSMMIAYYASAFDPVYFTVGSALFRFVGFLSLTIILAILVTALIDYPIAMLFKPLLDIKPPHQKPLIKESQENTDGQNNTPPLASNGGNVNQAFEPDEKENDEKSVDKSKQ
ncbi:nose resistant to fluoxetine protein 6-like [Leptidea sinapis]|uniref:nose resistant to fluoxetine protein 6-like n=1 Tax=Leptidea sinapis TaxID=189913 RepID=UPI0021C2FB82|nr:nose resistant to fluoxetine protein 6-like [Leptidea sinapis]